MIKTILLTYAHVDGYNSFGWFANIQEINKFVQSNKGISEIIECIDCSNVEKIDLELLGN